MENKRGAKWSGAKTSVRCPEALDMLKTGMLCCLLDDELTFRWGNSSFFSSIGYSRADFHSRFHSLRQYYAELPDEFILLRQNVLQAERNGGGLEMILRLPSGEGGFSWIKLYGTIADDPVLDTPVLRMELAGVDGLAAEKEGQERLYQQKLHYFHWMLDSYEGNVYISDMDTYELLYVNQHSCDVLGAPAVKLVGKKCYEVIQGRNSPCPFCTNDKLTEESFYEWEFQNPVLERTFRIKNRIINWEGHRARLELSHDMYSTEYKLAKKDQERDALIRSVPGGLVRVDGRDMRTVLWYSGGFLELIGYTKEQFEKELHSQCTYVHQDDMDRTASIMEQSRETGESSMVEGRVVTRDGTVKILMMTYSYVSGEDSWDGIPSYYSVGVDVTAERTEQARQRQALEDAYKAAQIANDAKTNFLSSMSHDIRTPMNAIIGMAVIAQANLRSPEKIQDCLNKINVSSRHLLSLINEVLDMSKIESGKIDLISANVSLPELIEDVMDVFRPLAAQKHQELQINADHVRHETVVTDQSRLQQVLVNLLSNAVKYTPDGGSIGLRVREVPSFAKGRGQYEFIVTDNGIGMSDAFIPHIFEPFSRAEESRINQIQGTGLGMAITQNIVRMMNGTIEVKSTLGEGSQFIVAVAFDLCEEAEENDSELSGLPVLVVDDDRIVCESAAEILDELGMRGSWVLSGQEAVRRVVDAHEAKEDFFSVILDWKMPEMDGLETLRAIRRELGMDVPVIVISAYDCSEIEEEFRLAGADAFITKPLFKSKIAHTFHQFCQSGRSEAAALPAEQAPFRLEGKRILIVEDNQLNREIAAELLKMQGFLIEEAANGQISVEKFESSAPGTYDCILMDIQMPVMDGLQAAEAIRALRRKDAKTVPILALTANAFASDVGKSHSAGMNDHVAKPIELDRLMETLQRWIR
ncbi:response regulator [Oscillibacter sp. MSJ-2]|uniref:histidine kinase n=1 Tax=Dysosmobacter acutus TaxID=2841504 RepID=A0ABS6FAI8_9FIRM|nr:PAS domain-containing hybrid sensor histidine kinase/response regulator [Dysosmobacter acutus]MBU5627303.1 response regulator [Dysosmobacter acutus]